MLFNLAIACFAYFTFFVAAQSTICTPSPGIRKTHVITFDDLDTAVQSVIPVPPTYNWLAFHPSWEVARNGSGLPFKPNSLYNALVSPSVVTTATAEFTSVCSSEPFDILSLWIIGCWSMPRYFPSDAACTVTFTGTKVNGTIVTWERPVRKTQMEIIQFATSRGFTGLKKFHMKSRFGSRNETLGRIALDDIVIARQDGKISC